HAQPARARHRAASSLRLPPRLPATQGQSSLFEIGERQALTEDLLVGLVPFAGNQHHIVRPRLTDGARDRLRAVDHLLGHRAGTGSDRLDDAQRVFRARVVAGDDHTIGERTGDLAHHRALARVAIATAAEHADETAAAG